MKEHPFTEKIIAQFFEGTLPEGLHLEVLNWFSSLPEAEQMEFMELHLSLAETIETDGTPPPAAGFRNIERQILDREPSRQKARVWAIRIAASLLPLLLIYFFSRQGNVTQKTISAVHLSAAAKMILIGNPLNRISRIQLPDSSTVSLYPGAMLNYPEGLKGNKREVVLSGKAFFSIKHNAARPFTVQTGTITTVVLGTSFWVDATKGAKTISIKVKTGKVGVLQADQPALFLLPSEKAVFNRLSGILVKVKQHTPEKIRRSPADNSPAALVFNRTPLKQVTKVLAENFSTQIILQESIDAELPVSLSTKGKTIAEVLEEIKSQIPIVYEIKDKQINIRKQE
jgi:transmembrane sensor